MMEFEITTRTVPEHHFNREKLYFPFDKLGLNQGFDVPIEFKSRVNYQLNAVVKNKAGNKRTIGLNKTQSDKEYRMFKSDKGEGYFQVIRVK
jgi:hypothetical protein